MLEWKMLKRGSSLGLVLVLAACASKAPAPVESRAPAAVQTNEMARVARPGYHIVQKGDTLYSIAYANQRDYRELAAWNGLSDPSVIEVGQELRVIPPAGAEPVVKPLAPAPALEFRPVTAPSVNASAPAAIAGAPQASANIKTEPKGGRLVYSPQAWKDLAQLADKTPVVIASAPAAVAGSAPAAAPATAEAPKPADSGTMNWAWPASGKVVGSFNDASNKGVDLAGNIGDPVLAAESGEVKYVGSSLRGYGNLVIIKHDSSFLSAYAHNQEVLVKEGQQVKKGQKIATLGNSDADRPKLHFEIRRQGKPVDPLKYLPSR